MIAKSDLFGKFNSEVRIDPEQCSEWGKKVLSMEKHWHHMGSGVSLGTIWYKFIADGLLHSYHNYSPTENKLLQNEFPELHEKMIFAAREVIGLELPLIARASKFNNRWSKFAFTIASLSSSDYADDVAYFAQDGAIIVHRDIEGISPYPELMFSPGLQAFSVVLSLAKPEIGGGLIIYPKRFDVEMFNAPSWSKGDNNDSLYKKLLAGEFVKPVVLDYSPGTLTVFDSLLFHEVMPMICSEENPHRIVALAHLLVLEKPYPHLEYWV